MTATAEYEAEQAYLWFARKSPRAAVRWFSGLLEAVNSLADHPERCVLAPEDEYFPEEIRNLFYGRRMNAYRVLFTIRGNRVIVLHVRHGAQQVLRPDEGEGE